MTDPSEQPSEWLQEFSPQDRDVLEAPDTSMSSMHDVLNASADTEFHILHPEAPEQLDPNDPSQAHLRQERLHTRDRIANELTDDEYYARDRAAGGDAGDSHYKIDPSDHSPGNQVQIEHWKQLHEEIVHGTPERAPYAPGDPGWEVPPALVHPDPMDPRMNVTPDPTIDPGMIQDPNAMPGPGTVDT